LFDPAATKGIGAHITLLYPFVPPDQLDDTVAGPVEDVVSQHRRFPFMLAQVRWFGDDVMWFDPEPVEPVLELTNALADAFPQHPRYAGRIVGDIIPHLTVANQAEHEQMHTAAAYVDGRLPVHCMAGAVTLLVGSGAPGS
jgi:hypothetical protein